MLSADNSQYHKLCKLLNRKDLPADPKQRKLPPISSRVNREARCRAVDPSYLFSYLASPAIIEASRTELSCVSMRRQAAVREFPSVEIASLAETQWETPDLIGGR
jgi:hypothetical protein